MTPQEELKTINDAIALATARKAELENELDNPKYPDGTPGYLWDGTEYKSSLVSLINTVDTDNPYSGTAISDEYRYSSYKNFAPIETAILGMKYRHEAGKQENLSRKDHILKICDDGREASGIVEMLDWSTPFDYYIIKRYK